MLLYQYALRTDSDTAEGVLELYRDGNTVSSWAKTAMEHAVGAGLITGSGGTLAPKRAATRAELARGAGAADHAGHGLTVPAIKSGASAPKWIDKPAERRYSLTIKRQNGPESTKNLKTLPEKG